MGDKRGNCSNRPCCLPDCQDGWEGLIQQNLPGDPQWISIGLTAASAPTGPH